MRKVLTLIIISMLLFTACGGKNKHDARKRSLDASDKAFKEMDREIERR